MTVPEHWTCGTLRMMRITPADLSFLQSLMVFCAGAPPNAAHPSPAGITKALDQDLSHWERWGFGRWIIRAENTPVGACALTHLGGYPGLNLSIDLDADWRALARDLARDLIAMAEDAPLSTYLHGLAPTADPAFAGTLEAAGFLEVAQVQRDGAQFGLWVRALGGNPPILWYGGAWQPFVLKTPNGLIFQAPIASGHADFTVKLPITAEDLVVLRADRDRAALAYAALHPVAQDRQGAAAMADVLHGALHLKPAELAPWLNAHDARYNGAVSNLLRIHESADSTALRSGQWLPLPRKGL